MRKTKYLSSHKAMTILTDTIQSSARSADENLKGDKVMREIKFPFLCQTRKTALSRGGIEGPCKPEGIAVELADVILRTLDLMETLGVDVDAVVTAKHNWNKRRAGL